MTKDLIVEDFEILSNCSVDKLLKLKHVSQDYVRETEQEFIKAKDRLNEINQELTHRGWGKKQLKVSQKRNNLNQNNNINVFSKIRLDIVLKRSQTD